MKLALFIAGLAAMMIRGWAEDVATIRVSVEMVGVPVEAGVRLAPRLRDRKTVAAAREQLEAMLVAGYGDLLDWPTLLVDDSTEGVTTAAEEFPHPAEFDRPSAPEIFGSSNHSSVGPWPIEPLVNSPTAFDTRALGSSLQLTAGVDRLRNVVQVKLQVSLLRLLDNGKWTGSETSYGTRIVTELSNFRRESLNSRFTLPRDEPILLGSFVVPRPLPQMIFFIGQASWENVPAVGGKAQP